MIDNKQENIYWIFAKLVEYQDEDKWYENKEFPITKDSGMLQTTISMATMPWLAFRISTNLLIHGGWRKRGL